MKGKLSMAVVLSAIVGFAQWCWLLPFCWMYIAIYDPTSHWLIAHGIEGWALLSALFVHDAIINILLCLPAAFILNQLRPRYLLAYLAIAVLSGCLWEYRQLLIHPFALNKSYGGMLAYGMAPTLLMLPAAVAVIRWCSRSANTAQ